MSLFFLLDINVSELQYWFRLQLFRNHYNLVIFSHRQITNKFHLFGISQQTTAIDTDLPDKTWHLLQISDSDEYYRFVFIKKWPDFVT